MKLPSVKEVVVIGGGVGGLITSGLLKKSVLQIDIHVTLLEKHESCGGRMNSEILKGPDGSQFRFDVGPSLLLLPDVYKETFQYLGSNISDQVELLPVSPFYRCYFEEDSTFADITSDINEMKQTADSIEKNGFDKLEKYMKVAGNFLRFGLPFVIEEKMDIVWKDLFAFLKACIRAFPLLSHHTMLSTFFSSSKMRAMMSFQDLYIGLSPYEAPAVFSLLQALELEKGIFYPKGGFGAVAKALQKCSINAGVDIRTKSVIKTLHFDSLSSSPSSSSNSNIQSTRTNNINSVIVVTNGVEDTLKADYVVTNIDASSFEQYLPIHLQDTRASEGRPSCGIVSIHLALSRRLSFLKHHTLYISSGYADSWQTVDKPDTSKFNPQCFNFYIHAPSRTDYTVCADNQDAITVLVPVPPLSLNNDMTYDTELQNIVREAVLQKLQDMEYSYMLQNSNLSPNPSSSSVTRSTSGCQEVIIVPAIRDSILAENIRAPIQWRNEFSLFRGSAFGLAHSLNQLSFLRPRFKHPSVGNLYRVGASTRPGNGVPLVMIGARLATNIIVKDLQSEK